MRDCAISSPIMSYVWKKLTETTRRLSTPKMAGIFKFSAEDEQRMKVKGSAEAVREISDTKRARADGNGLIKTPSNMSFKSKLMNSSNPDSWVGFGAKREINN
ncbi:hypothetical protein ACOSQ4_028213 [Xanthoceras sorbifolium]